jgi:hypothetical protein
MKTYSMRLRGPRFAFWKQHLRKRMASSGLLRRVALVIIDVSEELSAYVIRVTKIGELGTTLAVTSNRRPLGRTTKYLV